MQIVRGGKRSSPQRAPASAAVAERSRAAFAAFYREHYPRARKLARSKVGGLWADEVADDAFMDLWSCCFRDCEPPTEPVTGLLIRILRRRILDRLRADASSEARDEYHVEGLAPHIQNQTDTARVADGSLLAARMQYLAGALPPKLRRAFELLQLHGRDYALIAAELGVTQVTARWNVSEATRRIRVALEKDGYGVERRLEGPRTEGTP